MKEKFTKLLKNYKIKYLLFTILGVIIGGGIFGTLGIVATTNKLEAKYVMYTKDGKTMTVQDAIKDLYVLSKNNGGGNVQTLAIGKAVIDGYKVTVPYIGSYPSVRCVYGTTENYGSVGTLSGNTCVFNGLNANQTYYYKILATDNNGKFYENMGNVTLTETSISDNVNLGDYIYMVPTSTSELTVWRVIRKNSDGTVDVVSDNVSSNPVSFTGANGYDNFSSSLSSMASQYTNTSYVKSTRYIDESDTSLIKSVYGSLKAYNQSGSPSLYWLDSKYFESKADFYYDSYDDEMECTVYNYYVGYIDKVGNAHTSNDGYLLGKDASECYHGNTKNTKSAYLRPILTLKSTVKIIGGTGTASDYYKLGI